MLHHPDFEPGFGYKGGKNKPSQLTAAIKIDSIIDNDDILKDLDQEVEKFKKELENEKSQAKNQMKI